MKYSCYDSTYCARCNEEVDIEDSYFVPVTGTKDEEALCHRCYSEIIDRCMICEDEEILPQDVSNFEVIKLEDAECLGVPPGIYNTSRRKYTFVSNLPCREAEIYRSGIICKKCCKPYKARYKEIYSPYTQEKEIEHTRTLMLKTQMLRDLEYDVKAQNQSRANYWTKLKEKYSLPQKIQTYHEHIYLEHKGVKIFNAGNSDAWLTTHPEPRYRTHGKAEIDGVFAIWELPHYDQYFQQFIAIGEKEGVCTSIEKYAEQSAAKPTVIHAIDTGYLTQEGIVGQCCEILHF